jgi:hypothetical protein
MSAPNEAVELWREFMKLVPDGLAIRRWYDNNKQRIEAVIK